MRAKPAILFAAACVTCALSWAAGDDVSSSWREGTVPEPPPLRTAHVARIEIPAYSTVQVGVDLDSLSVSLGDGVVRYVVLLQGNDGARTAYYQGLHCGSFEVRTYARYRFDQQPPAWEMLGDTEWQPLSDTRSRYANAISKAGLCDGGTPPYSAEAARRVFNRSALWQDRSYGAIRY